MRRALVFDRACTDRIGVADEHGNITSRLLRRLGYAGVYSALVTDPDNDVDAIGFRSRRRRGESIDDRRIGGEIRQGAIVHVVEVVVLGRVRIVEHPGGIDDDLAHESALGEQAQSVVNRRLRDRGFCVGEAQTYLIGGQVVLSLEHNCSDFNALWSRRYISGLQDRDDIRARLRVFCVCKLHDAQYTPCLDRV